jgi:hypothetical protein
VISTPNGEVARNRSLEDRDRTPPVKKISSAHHNTASAFLAPHQITSFMPVQKGSYEQRVPGAAEKRDTKNGPRRDAGAVILSQIRHCETCLARPDGLFAAISSSRLEGTQNHGEDTAMEDTAMNEDRIAGTPGTWAGKCKKVLAASRATPRAWAQQPGSRGGPGSLWSGTALCVGWLIGRMGRRQVNTRGPGGPRARPKTQGRQPSRP